MEIPEEIHIDIGIDLADRLTLRDQRRAGEDAPNNVTRKVLPYEGKASIGLVTIKGNETYWNGRRITPQDELLLAEACRQGLEDANIPASD